MQLSIFSPNKTYLKLIISTSQSAHFQIVLPQKPEKIKKTTQN